jgi:hypothetical protein
VYRIADAADFSRQEGASRREGEEYLVWLAIFRQGPLTLQQVADALKLSETDCKHAIDRLLGEGRVRALPAAQDGQNPQDAHDGRGTRYASERFDVPVGAEGGYEAALLDHFQALVAAICVKLRAGAARSQADDATGGGTYTFAVWPGHPLEDEARSLLPRVRALVNDLRERVDRHNTGIEHPTAQAPVVFYMGQYVQSDDGLGGT